APAAVESQRSLRLGIAFVGVHVAALVMVLTCSWSVPALAIALVVYLVRGLAVTAVFHRLLSHGAYSTSRTTMLVGAAIATSAAQRGPLWWVGQHRRHHRTADSSDD